MNILFDKTEDDCKTPVFFKNDKIFENIVLNDSKTIPNKKKNKIDIKNV